MRRVQIPVNWDMHERFESKLLPGPPSPDENLCPGPCWAWSGAHFQKTGYAMFSVKCEDGKWRPTTAHRIAWRLYRGEFDPELEPDHLCRNRGCVNPWHGDPVTRSVNMLRGMHPTAVLIRERMSSANLTEAQYQSILSAGRTARAARKADGACLHGHEMTEENTLRRKNGKHECRTCVRERDNARNQNGRRQEHYRKMYQQRKQRALASQDGDLSPNENSTSSSRA